LDGKHNITVSEWRPDPLPHRVRECAAQPSRVAPAIYGCLGTLVLHGLALQSIDWGGLAREAQRPEVLSPGASATTAAISTAPLVLLEPIEPAAAATSLFDEFAAADAAPLETPVSAVDLNPVMLALGVDADAGSPTEVAGTSGDMAASARLVGIYTAQMQARIERLWRRPRTPVSDKQAAADGVFHCQARVVQDSQGNVEEVRLPHCNGSAAWQRSLVMAIEEASPLPAPPDPKVFSRWVRLRFTGYPYRPGSPAAGYEVAVPLVARSAAASH